MQVIANINPLAAAAAVLLQSKNDVRPMLNGVYIEPRKAGGITLTATNGHALLSVIDPDGSIDEPAIWVFSPATMTQCKARKALRLEILLVPQTEWDDSKPRPPRDYLARVTGIDHVTACKVIDAQFPDWRAVLPAKLPTTAAAGIPAVAAGVLAPLLTAAKLFNSRYPAVRLVYQGEQKSIPVQFSCTAPLSARGVVMPLRSEAFGWEV